MEESNNEEDSSSRFSETEAGSVMINRDLKRNTEGLKIESKKEKRRQNLKKRKNRKNKNKNKNWNYDVYVNNPEINQNIATKHKKGARILNKNTNK